MSTPVAPVKAKVSWASVWKILKWVLVGFAIVFLIAFAASGRLNLGGIIESILGGKGRPKAKINNKPILGGTVVPVLPNTDPLRNKSVLQLADGTEVELEDKSIIDTQVRAVVIAPGGIYYAQTDTGNLTSVFGGTGGC